MQYIFTTFAHSATLSSFFQRHLTIEQFLASIGFALPGKIANNSSGRRKKNLQHQRTWKDSGREQKLQTVNKTNIVSWVSSTLTPDSSEKLINFSKHHSCPSSDQHLCAQHTILVWYVFPLQPSWLGSITPSQHQNQHKIPSISTFSLAQCVYF